MSEPSAFACGLSGCCPRCGARTLFRNVVAFNDRCGACGLDYAGMNVGDGPAPFLIFGIGALIVGLALWLEFTLHPPWWVHALVWPPVVFGLTIGLLRIAKGMLLAITFRREAREGRSG